jgi:hypothetical protein
MSDHIDPYEPFRHTLDRLVLERKGMAAQLRGIDAAIEQVVRYIPEEERHIYLNCLSDRGDGSRFTPETTLAEAAEMVLRHFGEAMRGGAIVKVLREWRFPYDKDDAAMQASVGAILLRKAARGDTFTKAGAGLFGLAAWDEKPVAQPERERAPQQPVRQAGVTPINTAVRTGTDPRPLSVSQPRTTQKQTVDYDDFRAPPLEEDDLPF